MREAPTKPAGRLLRGPPAYEPLTPWRAGPALAASVAIVGLAFLAAWLAPRVLHLGGGATAMPNPVHPEIPASSLWVVAIFQIVAVALTLLASVAFGGRLRDVLALRRAAGGWRAYAGAILAMVALQVVAGAVTYSLIEHDMLADLRPFVGLVSGPYWPLAAAVLGIGAPLSEELLFRGLLYSSLRTRWSAVPSILVTAVLFAYLHEPYRIFTDPRAFPLPILYLGIVLGLARERTSSVVPGMVMHALNNALAFALSMKGMT